MKALRAVGLCLTPLAAVALAACQKTADEVKEIAQQRGLPLDTSREVRKYYNDYLGVPVNIGSPLCTADLFNGEYLFIFGPDGKPLSNSNSEDKFYDLNLDVIKNLSQTTVCYPKGNEQK